jgi:hypothetical protein
MHLEADLNFVAGLESWLGHYNELGSYVATLCTHLLHLGIPMQWPELG